MIGIDIHQATLMIAVHDGRQWERPNTDAGRALLAEELRTLRPERVVLEPSGGYERPVCAVLHAAAVPVALVNPQQVRHFLKGQGINAKADRLDARMLARFGAMMCPRLMIAPSPARARIVALTTRRRQVRQMHADELRRRTTADPAAHASLTRSLTMLEDELAQLDGEIAAIVAGGEPSWQRARAILISVPGIGAQTAALLLAALPELGQLDAKKIAALVGVAPLTHQSGASAGTAEIRGGRTEVRTGLWMPTLAAKRHNPVIAAFAARLTARGKPAKVVTTACGRKLVTILNAMIAKDPLWHPDLAHA